jgi:hypothetical protein
LHAFHLAKYGIIERKKELVWMKKLLAGLIVGFMIGAAGTAIAADETVQAKFAKFNFVIDGEKVDPGADPLVYQGTTYLPVRVISNMLGYDVVYRADSRTIEIWDQKTKKEVNEMSTETNLDGWVRREDLPALGTAFYYTALGEMVLKKDDVKFIITGETPKLNTEKTYEYEGKTLRMKSTINGYYFNADDLRAAGLLD